MSNSLPRFRRAAFLGFGLIGGSLAAAMKRRGLVDTVVASARSQRTLDEAFALGLADIVCADPCEAVRGADLVVLAMPVGATAAVLATVREALAPDAIITDVGSVKGAVVKAARTALGTLPPGFVPGHPIAGAEKSGVGAANADLYVDHKVILTPLDSTSADALHRVRALWEGVGANVLVMTPEHHDEVLAATSHLPHLLAYTLVDCLAHLQDNREIFRYAAGGFRDFTRIASSDPVMWRDIFLNNRDGALKVLDRYTRDLDAMRAAIAAGDGEALLGVFTRAKSARDHFTAMNLQTGYVTAHQLVQSGAPELLDRKSIMTHGDTKYRVAPGGSVSGRLRVPGDKSISHRSIMLGSLAEGITEVEGFLEGEDALATLQAFRDMGVVIEGPAAGRVRVHGVGMRGLKPAAGALYMGNSGTSMRLLSGILCAQAFDSELTGDSSLSKRPMERAAKPLRLMGAEILTTGEKGTPPVKIRGGRKLKGIHYDLPVASAQVKSAILLAGLWADGETSVTEPAPTRDHSERMLRGFGYDVKTEGNRISMKGGGKLKACRIDVPADISSAAFFMVAASIAPGSDIVLEHVGINPTRTGVIDILKLMGGDLTVMNERVVGGEPVADIRVRYAPLKGIEIPEHLVPLAIDEFPVLFVAASCASGRTVLTGAEELRVKESDRIQVMADGLKVLGIDARPTPDGIVIEGKGGSDGAVFGSGEITSHNDHRIAMSFTVAALRAKGEILIHDCATVSTSFPGFDQLAARAGIRIRVEQV
ncbi:MAG: bifunctional prephenate dehydrogenase/3-phosphoshikimate 1-carboxyvinyltransferase [Gammaproteobacteria bacterium]